MKKNLLKAMVALVLLPIIFTGCSKKFDSFESVGVYDGVEYPRFLSTDWGMSVDETFKALGVEKVEGKPFEVETEIIDGQTVEPMPTYGDVTIYTVNLVVGGNEIEVDLSFGIDPDGTDFGLIGAGFDLPNAEVTDEINALMKTTKFYEKNMFNIGTEKDALELIRPQYEYVDLVLSENSLPVNSEDEWVEACKSYYLQSYLGKITVRDNQCSFDGWHAAVFKKILPDK